MVNLKRGSKKNKEKENKGKKEINLNISLTNRWLYTLIVVAVLLIAGVGVYAYSQSIPNPGHGGDSVLVSVDGEEKTLQEAIDEEKLGGDSSDVFHTQGKANHGDTINVPDGYNKEQCSILVSPSKKTSSRRSYKRDDFVFAYHVDDGAGKWKIKSGEYSDRYRKEQYGKGQLAYYIIVCTK